MKGWDDKCDGKLRLRTELVEHKAGRLECPTQVDHAITIENVSVCDLQVAFVSEPKIEMLSYVGVAAWEDSFPLKGASSPRRDRSDERHRFLEAGRFTDEGAPQLRGDVDIASSARYLGRNGSGPGPARASVSAMLKLTLVPGR